MHISHTFLFSFAGNVTQQFYTDNACTQPASDRRTFIETNKCVLSNSGAVSSSNSPYSSGSSSSGAGSGGITPYYYSTFCSATQLDLSLIGSYASQT